MMEGALSWQMPYNIFRSLSDEDLAAVVVYIKSLPAIYNVVPPTRISDQERTETQKYLRPILKGIPEPDISTKIKRGQYLVRLGECIGCHTSHSEYNPGIFGGGNHVTRYQSTAFSANLTRDSSGIGYGEEGFKFVIRTGKGGTLSPAMPWIAYKNLNDDDIKAIYSYLRTLPPARHYVNNQTPFTHCDICGIEHGLGDKNKRRRPAGIFMNPDLYEQFVGTYREDEWQSTYIVSHKGSQLIAKGWDKGVEYELVPQSELAFAAEGLPIPITFVKDKNGHITQIVEATDYGRTFKRVDTSTVHQP
jgi:mono/diheme cytochrome c family protein